MIFLHFLTLCDISRSPIIRFTIFLNREFRLIFPNIGLNIFKIAIFGFLLLHFFSPKPVKNDFGQNVCGQRFQTLHRCQSGFVHRQGQWQTQAGICKWRILDYYVDNIMAINIKGLIVVFKSFIAFYNSDYSILNNFSTL